MTPIMRIRTVVIVFGLFAPLATPVLADAHSYCELYSKDFADGRTTHVDKWQLLYRGAFSDCMLSYNAKPSADAPTTTVDAEPVQLQSETVEVPETQPAKPEKLAKKVAAKPAPRKIAAKKTTTRVAARNLIPGTEAWNSYCANKYTSFNKQSGTYLSNSGKIRRCSTTR